jgi:hypothetical protein
MLPQLGWKTWRIYHGVWGSALFQSVYHTSPPSIIALPTTPEWYLVVAVLAVLAALSPFVPALLFAIPLLALAASLPVIQAIASGLRAIPRTESNNQLWKRRAIVSSMWLTQPASRLIGRMRAGLSPWRFRRGGFRALPRRRGWVAWSEKWEAPTDRLKRLESMLREHDAVTVRGGDFAAWDLQVLGGVMGSARLKLTVEEHGDGQQMVRLRAWPKWARTGRYTVAGLTLAASAAAIFGAYVMCGMLATGAAAIALLAVEEMTIAMGVLVQVVQGDGHVPSKKSRR